MKISFDIGIEDSMAFYRHFFDTDPNVRKQWRQPYFIGPALFTILGLVLTTIGMWFPLIVSTVFVIVWLLFYPRFIRSMWLKKVREQLLSGGGLPENRMMEFTGEQVTNEIPGKAHETLQWDLFVKSVETTDYFFLYVSNTQVVIVPKRTMSAAEVDELTQLLNNKIKR